MSFGMRPARQVGKGFELVPDKQWFFVDTQLLQELIDLADEESDADGEGVFNFDWYDHALYAELSQVPTARDCRQPKEMLEVLHILKKRMDSNPQKYADYASLLPKMINLCEDANKNGYFVHTSLT